MREELLKALSSTRDAVYRSGGTELAIQCPRCYNDHHSAHGHLYIETMNPTSMRISCKHCGLGGLLSPQILHEIGIENLSFDEYLTKLNSGPRNQYIRSDDANSIVNFRIPTKIDKKDRSKVQYVCERTNIDFFNKVNIIRYRLIIDLELFLSTNQILLDKNPDFIHFLNENYIGFLSYNSNIINLRLVKKQENAVRYINLKLNKLIESQFLYVPPLELDLLTRTPIIVLAEGVYDILCIRKRYYTDDTHNIIFAAVGTKGGFKNGIIRVLKLTGFFGAEINIYSDKDVSLEFYEKMLKSTIKPIAPIKIHYTNDPNKKDFGNMQEILGAPVSYKL
jgi:hypothetical protein